MASPATTSDQAYFNYTDASGNANNTVVFDCVLKEDWTHNASATEHPVEQNSNITDHVRVELAKCSLDIFATNEPIGPNNWDAPSTDNTSLDVPEQTADPVNTNIVIAPHWESFGGFPLSLLDLISPIAAAGIAIAEAIVGTGTVIPTPTSVTAGYTPSSPSGSANIQTFDNPMDYVQKMINLLNQLKNSAQIISVVGSKETNPSMIIEEFTYTREEGTGTGAMMHIGLKEVRFVQTQQVGTPLPAVPRATTPVNKGNQTPADASPAQQQSAALSLANAGGNFVSKILGSNMTVQLVPTYNAPFNSQNVTLEGVSYVLNVTYSQVENTWYMSIADANGVDIYNGMKLICSTPSGPNPMLFKCRDPRIPPGDFFVLSGTTDYSPPGINDLIANSGRCILVYMTSDVLSLVGNGGYATFVNQLNTNTTNGQGSTYGQIGVQT